MSHKIKQNKYSSLYKCKHGNKNSFKSAKQKPTSKMKTKQTTSLLRTMKNDAWG